MDIQLVSNGWLHRTGGIRYNFKLCHHTFTLSLNQVSFRGKITIDHL